MVLLKFLDFFLNAVSRLQFIFFYLFLLHQIVSRKTGIVCHQFIFLKKRSHYLYRPHIPSSSFLTPQRSQSIGRETPPPFRPTISTLHHNAPATNPPPPTLQYIGTKHVSLHGRGESTFRSHRRRHSSLHRARAGLSDAQRPGQPRDRVAEAAIPPKTGAADRELRR